MTTRFASVAAALLLLSTTATAQPYKLRMAHIGLIYPISSNGINAHEYTNVISLHAIAGVSRGEIGLCASGVTNVVLDKIHGAVLGGFSNHILGNATGLQAAGFVNTVKNDSKGFQAAGFANVTKNMIGFQAAGFTNVITSTGEGFQAGGFGNFTGRYMRGSQAAGFINVAKHVDGVQVAGFINVAESVHSQFAGFINIAKEVKGVQASGFINISDSCDFPIGIINIVRKGEKAIGVSVDENGTGLATFRSGGRVMYGIVGVGGNVHNERNMWAVEAGIGAHLNISKGFRINIEGTSMLLATPRYRSYAKSTLRVMPSLMLGKMVEIYAGPSVNHFQSEDFDERDLGTNFIWSSKSFGYFNGITIGGMAGIQFHL